LNLCIVCAGSFANSILATQLEHRAAQHWQSFASDVTLNRVAVRLSDDQLRSPRLTAKVVNGLLQKESAVAAFEDIAIICAGVAALGIPLTIFMRPAKLPDPKAAEATSPPPATSELPQAA